MKPDPNPISGGQAAKDDTISEGDLIAFLAGGDAEETEEQAEETEEESEESTEEEEAEESEEAAEEETEEEQEESEAFDLDNLTDEQLEAYRVKFKSRLAADVAKLRREKRDADAEIARLQALQPQQAAPLEEVNSRLLEGIDTLEALNAKAAELKKLGKETARLLADHEEYGPDDPIDVGGKRYTKRQLRALDFEVRETLDEAVPYKQAQFQRQKAIERQAEEIEAKVRDEVPELSQEDSKIAQGYKELTESSEYRKIIAAAPEAKAWMPYLIGHALRSIHGKTPKPVKPVTAGKTPKAKPPGSPSGVAAPAAKAPSNGAGKLREKAQQTGSREDLEAYLESIL